MSVELNVESAVGVLPYCLSTNSLVDRSRWRPHVVGGRKEPFDGVVLGPLLGKGSFGRVYRALWDGKPVAVKVRSADDRRLGNSAAPRSGGLFSHCASPR